jgi:ATP-dependent DNA helicase RecG
MSSSRNPDAQQRLKVLEQSQDGFFISEMDMRFRGPGEVMGTRQSGVADLTLASLVEDEEVLLLARQAAERVIDMDVSLERWPLMKDELRYRYKRLMEGAILT